MSNVPVKRLAKYLPGSAGGKARSGSARIAHRIAATRKPIHQAPTHTLLFGVSPNLKRIMRISSVTKQAGVRTVWYFFLLKDVVSNSEQIYNLVLEIWTNGHSINYSKGKAVPLQAWSGPEGSRKLRFPDYMTTAQDGGKVVSRRHRPPLPQGNTPGTHFC